MAVISRQRGRDWAYNSTPWVAYEHEMAAKTMIRRIAKSLPLSIEMANATQLDEMSDRGTTQFDIIPNNTDLIGDFSAMENIEQETDKEDIQPEQETKTTEPVIDLGDPIEYQIVDIYGEVIKEIPIFEKSEYSNLLYNACKEYLESSNLTEEQLTTFKEYNEQVYEYVTANDRQLNVLNALFVKKEPEIKTASQKLKACEIIREDGRDGAAKWKTQFLEQLTTAPDQAFIDDLIKLNHIENLALQKSYPNSYKAIEDAVKAKQEQFI